MGEKKGHEQTWIRVNTHVDRKIAELIKALSLFPKLRTIESCQGDSAKGKNHWIWVSFEYGESRVSSWRDLSEFVLGYFGPGLTTLLGDTIDIFVRVTEAGWIQAELYVCPDSLMKAVRAVKSLAHKFNN